MLYCLRGVSHATILTECGGKGSASLGSQFIRDLSTLYLCVLLPFFSKTGNFFYLFCLCTRPKQQLVGIWWRFVKAKYWLLSCSLFISFGRSFTASPGVFKRTGLELEVEWLDFEEWRGRGGEKWLASLRKPSISSRNNSVQGVH